MIYTILKEQEDEAGNVGYVFDEEVEMASEQELKDYLFLLNQEGYDHFCEIKEELGVRIVRA